MSTEKKHFTVNDAFDNFTLAVKNRLPLDVIEKFENEWINAQEQLKTLDPIPLVKSHSLPTIPTDNVLDVAQAAFTRSQSVPLPNIDFDFNVHIFNEIMFNTNGTPDYSQLETPAGSREHSVDSGDDADNRKAKTQEQNGPDNKLSVTKYQATTTAKNTERAPDI
jgi:hypothetical protein